MLAGLSVHSFLEGFTIGHEKKDDGEDYCDFHLFASFVLFTKILLAFFAGVKGVKFNDRIYSGPLADDPKKYIMWTFIIIFILMSPLGLGYVILKTLVCHNINRLLSDRFRGHCSQSITGIVIGMVTGPFEEDSLVNQNILLLIEACGTGTFAYVVFIKILPKQFSFVVAILIVCFVQTDNETERKLKKIEYHQANVCLNFILMSVGFIITVGLQLINQLGKFSKHRLLDIALTLPYEPYDMAI